MEFTLVPFGWSVERQSMVDVADVRRGKASGCTCPSCSAPLIARQGVQKQWHFAHASRKVYGQTEGDCEFSFFVSVRMMARQLVGDRIDINLPAFRDQVVSGGLAERFTITEARTITLSGVQVETNFAGVTVDVLGSVGDFSFALFLSHPGRAVPELLATPTDRRCGVVALDLTSTSKIFAASRDDNRSHAAALSEFLTRDTESKQWVFHPKHMALRAQAQARLEQRVRYHGGLRNHGFDEARADTQGMTSANTLPAPRQGEFRCAVCNLVWLGPHPGLSPCPRCQTHLHGRFERYV